MPRSLVAVALHNATSRNPFDDTIEISVSEYFRLNSADSSKHPCGSSAGSTTGVAAAFAPLALGTETRGSISCSASAIVLHGPKVFTGALSRSGNLPTATTFDSPGVLVKSAWDFAALLTDTKGTEPQDPVTIESKSLLVNYTTFSEVSWVDLPIGVADKLWLWSILPGLWEFTKI